MSLVNLLGHIATDERLELLRALVAELDGKITLNEDGRIKVASMPALYELVTGNITAVGGTLPMNVSNISNVMLHCKPSGSVAGHNSTFEGSLDSTNGVDGTWFTLQAVRSNANTVETTSGVLAAAPVYGWEMSVNALRWIRVRTTAHTSGIMTWMIQPGSYATEPIPAVQTHSVSISTVSPTLYADTTAVLAAGATYTGTSRDGGSSAIYTYFCARAYSDQSGTLFIDDSTDGTTWRLVESVAVAAGESKTLEVRVLARYNRVRYVNGAVAQGAMRITSGYRRI